MTAVDINSGKIGGETNFKDMVLKTNTEAAEEIAHQLMLRDIGGQIVIDFIEMRDPKHCREVEKAMRTAMKSDRARLEIGKLSRFGLMEIVRQRLGSSALSAGFETCSCCKGSGLRRSLEWQTILTIKDIYSRLRRKACPNPLEIRVPMDLVLYMLNNRRAKLDKLEEEYDRKILILPEN